MSADLNDLRSLGERNPYEASVLKQLREELETCREELKGLSATSLPPMEALVRQQRNSIQVIKDVNAERDAGE